MECEPYKTDLGLGWVVAEDDDLVEIILPGGGEPQGAAAEGGPRTRSLAEQLTQYYSGALEWLPHYELCEKAGNTPLQREIYRVVSAIRPGDTMSYGEVAAAAGRPKAARAVGTAMARNPFPPIIPCHRVVASNGGLGGYAGGLDMKRQMLTMEREQGHG